VDKKLHEKDLLPGEKLPVDVMPVHDAWIEMKKKLEDEMPGAAIVIPAINKNTWQKRLLRGSLLLLLLLITFLFIYKLNKRSESSKVVANREAVSNNHHVPTDKNSLDKKQSNSKFQDTPVNESNENKTEFKDGSINPINISGKNISVNKKDQKKIVNYKRGKTDSNRKNKNVFKSKKKQASIDSNESNSVSETAAMNIPTEIQKSNGSVIQQNATAYSAVKKDDKKDIQKDSVQTSPKVDDEIPQRRPIISAGLQWNFQLPIYSGENYFKGSSGKSQPYMVLLPGAWISVQNERRSLSAELNPFYSNLLPAKSFGIFTSYANLPDTIVMTTETKTLEKTFGIHFAANYDLNISGNWWAGGGIHAYWLKKGIASSDGTEEKRSISNGGVVSTSFNQTYILTKPEWENFDRFQLWLHAQAFYARKKMQTGIRIGIPFNSIAKQQGQKNPLRTEMIFRLPLYLLNTKSKSRFISNE